MGGQRRAVELKIESIKDCWDEGQALVRAEAEEVEPDGRDLKPHFESYLANEQMGLLKVLTARVDGRLVGYLTWQVDFDMESYGTLIANQCAWYVEPGHFGLAVRMFDWAVDYFKSIGVKFVYWHHTVNGRGKAMGRFFEKRGAKLISHNYAMRL